MNHLPHLLKNHRKKSGLTQKQLASLIHFNHTVISRAENPDSGYLPTRIFIQKFCSVLALSPEMIETMEKVYEQALLQREQKNPPEQELLEQPRHVEDLAWQEKSANTAAPFLDRKRSRYWVGAACAVLALALFLYVWLRAEKQTLAHEMFSELPSGALVYSEDFENSVGADWESLNSGKWEVRVVENSKAFGVFRPEPKAVPNAFLTRSLGWDNYSVSADVKFDSGSYEQIYFVVRNAGEENNCSGYRVGGNRLGLSIFRFENLGDCDGAVLAENIDYPLREGQWYHMRVDAQGDKVRLFIDNQLVVEAEDTQYPRGGIGLLAYQVDWAAFDNIRVVKR